MMQSVMPRIDALPAKVRPAVIPIIGTVPLIRAIMS